MSTGNLENKLNFLQETRFLSDMGFKLYATSGSAKFMKEHGIKAELLHWPLEKKEPNVSSYVSEGKIDLVINIPKNLSSHELSNDYTIRRSAVDYNIPLITNARLASAFIYAICKMDIDEISIRSWNEYF